MVLYDFFPQRFYQMQVVIKGDDFDAVSFTTALSATFKLNPNLKI